MSHQDWKEINIGRRPTGGASTNGTMKQAKDPKAVAAVRPLGARAFACERLERRVRDERFCTDACGFDGFVNAGASRGYGGADGEEGCGRGRGSRRDGAGSARARGLERALRTR